MNVGVYVLDCVTRLCVIFGVLIEGYVMGYGCKMVELDCVEGLYLRVVMCELF